MEEQQTDTEALGAFGTNAMPARDEDPFADLDPAALVDPAAPTAAVAGAAAAGAVAAAGAGAAEEAQDPVTRHYTRSALLSSVLDAVAAAGKSVAPLDSDDVSPMDEMHTGSRLATERVAGLLAAKSGAQVLDLGCGLGGSARYLARHHGCQVTGVDLTRENIEVAEELTKRCGLAEQVSFRQGDVTALPFGDDAFDGAVMLHVGMNVEHKAALCAQAARVLRPGGRLVVYDLMTATEDGAELTFPLPWANHEEISFVEPVAEYRRVLGEAGFTVGEEQDLREPALAQFAKLRELTKENMPPIGMHVVMGDSFFVKIRNLGQAIADGHLVPTLLVAEAG